MEINSSERVREKWRESEERVEKKNGDLTLNLSSLVFFSFFPLSPIAPENKLNQRNEAVKSKTTTLKLKNMKSPNIFCIQNKFNQTNPDKVKS